MAYTCELREQPLQPALSIRARTATQGLPEVLGKAFGAIMQYMGELGAYPVGPPFVAYYNMDMQHLDAEIGFPVAKSLPGRGEIGATEIPGGKVATCLHTGPYNEVGSAYDALSKWMQEKGYEPTGVVYEVYLNDPNETPPDQLQTQIVFPLKAG